MHFDRHGNLEGGIIQSNITDLKKNLVDFFSASTTRKRNFKSFLELINFIKREGLLDGVSCIWIDGSFCTTKVDPNDIDLIILLKPFNKSAIIIDENQQLIRKMFIDKYLDIYMTYDSKCLQDTVYIEKVVQDLKVDILDYNEEEIKEILVNNCDNIDYQMKYWMGQFGFDRDQRSKGLISIEGGSL